MPWKESCRMDERMRFVVRLLDGERMTDLCHEFGISRKTGYKFLERYRNLGTLGISDQSRAPIHIPQRTTQEIEKLILALREKHSSWGPRKLKAKLEELHPGLKIPAASTIGEILSRSGYIEMKRRRREKNFFPTQNLLTESQKPNDVWCIDFKGQFRLGNGKYCYPLTISDHYSRYLIGCEALENTRGEGTFAAFEAAFSQYGLPQVIRSDNGAPFASTGLAGLSQLSAWFIRLGIRPERIEPGHPEQNGRHERMHLTLKKETTRPASKNLLQQQEVFDRFREIYNQERPHEALQMKSPAKVYQSSDRLYDGDPELDYPLHDFVRTVMKTGYIRLPEERRCFITRALTGSRVGVRETEPNLWLISYANLDLGYVDLTESYTALSVDNPRKNETKTIG